MQFVSRGYWDPEESTREKWTNTYASELQERGLSQDFTGLSELLLGQAQPAQFQSAGQTGYWWGSKVSDDGSFTALSSVKNNTNAEMPRDYHEGNDSYGDYYNWYAATAESGTYTMVSGNAEDSLCPAGWQLPNGGDNTTNKSFSNLLFATYSLVYTNLTDARWTLGTPLLFKVTGELWPETGIIGGDDHETHYWEREASSNSQAKGSGIGSQKASNGKYIFGASDYSKTIGFTVRCIKK